MSIKGFHLIFITVAALFCGCFSAWALFLNETEQGKSIIVAGVVTLISTVALIIYGFQFRRKTKDIKV